MEFTATHTFDAPIEKVWAMFTDEASHVAKFEGMGHREVKVESSSFEDGTFRVRITRLVDLDLPGFAKKVLKPTNTVISDDEWNDHGDGTYGGGFTLDTVGAPVKIAGTTRLTPDGDATRYDLKLDVSVNVPLIGGKILSWAKGDVEKQMAEEFEAGDAWLASH